MQTYTFFLIFSDVLSNKLNNKAFLTISNNFLISKVMFLRKNYIFVTDLLKPYKIIILMLSPEDLKQIAEKA